MTKPKTDYEKALTAAAKAYAEWMTRAAIDEGRWTQETAERALTILAHWPEGDDPECECPVCLDYQTIPGWEVQPD